MKYTMFRADTFSQSRLVANNKEQEFIIKSIEREIDGPVAAKIIKWIKKDSGYGRSVQWIYNDKPWIIFCHYDPRDLDVFR